jgi:hypothetical protein
MKVFALGGYGNVGLPAIKLLAASDLVTRIAVAGRDLSRAEKAAAEIGEKGVAVQVDGTDEKKLASLLAGHDIIVNTTRSNTVPPAVRAAIRTGAHYCDAAHGDVHEQAQQLDAEAKAAGMTAILANGITPGITNMIGVHMARQLEETEQLQLGRADLYNFRTGEEVTPQLWLKAPQETLVTLHKFKWTIGWLLRRLHDNDIRTVRVYHSGRWIEVDPIRSGVQVPLPQGGTVATYPFSSTVPVFGGLPSDLSRAPAVEMFFGPFPPQLHDLLLEQALRVIEEEVDPEAAVDSFYDTIERDPHRWLTPPDDFPVLKMWGRAVGRREGRAARYTCWFTAPMWNVGGYVMTSVALVVAVLKILRGDIRERGVMTAETTFEFLPFFDDVVALLPDPLERRKAPRAQARGSGDADAKSGKGPTDEKLIDESFEWLE